MSEKQPHAAQVLHWLAIWKCTFFVSGTLTGCTLAALSGMDWATSDTQAKVMVCIGIFAAFSSTMGAFIDNSLKQAKDGKDPITGLSNPPFASQAQADAGLSKTTVISPATLANLPAVKAADEQLPKI